MNVKVKLIFAGLVACTNFESLSSKLHQDFLSRNLLHGAIIKCSPEIRSFSKFSLHGHIGISTLFSRLRGGYSRPWSGISCSEADADTHVDIRNHPRSGMDHAPWIEAHRQAYIELREHNRTVMLARQAAGEAPPPPLISWQFQATDTRKEEKTQTWADYWEQVCLPPSSLLSSLQTYLCLPTKSNPLLRHQLC